MPTITQDQEADLRKRVADINSLVSGVNQERGTNLSGISVPSAAAPIKRTIYGADQPAQPGAAPAPTYSPAEQFLDTFRQPETSAQIAERKRQQSQGLIDAINKNYETQIAERKAGIHQERLSMDNAISVITGNTGGSEAVRTRGKVMDANQKEIDAINNQRALDLARIYTQISSDADAEAREQLADATRNAEQVLARREQSQAKALDSLKIMAASGLVDFDAFKNSPESSNVYRYALDAVGGSEDALRGVFMLNRPQDQIIGQPVRMGNNFVQAYQNPLTGKVTYEKLDLPFDLPVEYNNFMKMGNNLVAIPDNWDGDTSKLKTVFTETPAAAKRDTQVVDVGGRKVLIDTQTGQEISTIGGGAPVAQKYGSTDFYDISGGKPLNVDEGKARQFAVAAYNAGKLLDTSEYKLGNIEWWKPNALKSSDRQQFENAARAFVNATLRRESGATITDTEFENKYAELIPAPGDRKATLDQKAAARSAAVETIASAAKLSLSSGTAVAPTGDLRSQVISAGYDYDSLRADGFSDDQIRASLGL